MTDYEYFSGKLHTKNFEEKLHTDKNLKMTGRGKFFWKTAHVGNFEKDWTRTKFLKWLDEIFCKDWTRSKFLKITGLWKLERKTRRKNPKRLNVKILEKY